MTPDQLRAALERAGYPVHDRDHAMDTIAGWLERGDAAAVYENHDLSSGLLGDVRVISYGSSAAMLEDTDTPPTTMPDIGGVIGWRYQLIGTVTPAGDE